MILLNPNSRKYFNDSLIVFASANRLIESDTLIAFAITSCPKEFIKQKVEKIGSILPFGAPSGFHLIQLASGRIHLTIMNLQDGLYFSNIEAISGQLCSTSLS